MPALEAFNEDIWPEPYSVDNSELEQATSEEPFLYMSRELLKECIILTGIAFSVRLPGDGSALDRNQAIIVGHAARMIKLMRTALRMSDEYSDGDQQMALSRQYLDSASTVVFILEQGIDSPRFDAYVNDSLISENEFLKTIDKQIRERGGGILPIEARMQRSIAESFRLAGVRPEELPARNRQAWPSAEQRITRLGPTAYAAYRMGSNGIHGGWTDIEKHHLEVIEGLGFTPTFDDAPARPQPLLMMCGVSVVVIRLYVSLYLASAVGHFNDRLDDFSARLHEVDSAHEDFLNTRRSDEA